MQNRSRCHSTPQSPAQQTLLSQRSTYHEAQNQSDGDIAPAVAAARVAEVVVVLVLARSKK